MASTTHGRSLRLPVSHVIFSLACALLAVSQGVETPVASGDTATLIAFEQSIPVPGNVTSQYCNSPAMNKGVRFLDPIRRIEPAVGTMTPPHAVTSHFAGGESRRL